MSGLQVVETGPQALLVTEAAAADPRSWRIAWDLVAGSRATQGPADERALEVAVGPFELRVGGGAATVALAGADLGARLLPSGRLIAPGSSVLLRKGDRLRLEGPTGAAAGLRAYIAASGGLTSGGGPVRAGRLGIAAGEHLAVAGPSMPEARWAGPVTLLRSRLRVVPGPHVQALGGGALAAFLGADWTVGTASDRQGLRLQGSPLPLQGNQGDLASIPVVPGVVQVPPDRLPIILGPDAQPTGGYPVIAVVAAVDRPALGQLGPGHRIRFEAVSAEEARDRWLEDRAALCEARRHLAEAALWDDHWRSQGG